MPVMLFTFHTYRSWSEDNPRGYVQRGDPSVQAPSIRLARYRAKIAKSTPVLFDDDQEWVIIDSAREICAAFNWRLHAAAATPTHVHLLVSWKDRRTTGSEITTLLKRKLGNRLSRHKGTTGNRWFSRGADRTPIRDRAHFDHHCLNYLPDHVNQNGVFWCERTPESQINAPRERAIAPHANAVPTKQRQSRPNRPNKPRKKSKTPAMTLTPRRRSMQQEVKKVAQINTAPVHNLRTHDSVI